MVSKNCSECKMDIEEYKERMKNRKYIFADTDAHRLMHGAAERARRITCEINGSFHTAEELRALFSELIGQPLDENFALFPPFYTDFGRNIALGRGVFINAGCCFQDQGGIEIGDKCLIGHQVVLATLNHDPAPEKRGNMLPAPHQIGKARLDRRTRDDLGRRDDRRQCDRRCGRRSN